MNEKCKKCKGLNMAAGTLAFIIACPHDVDRTQCPYLGQQYHLYHEEYRLPESYSHISAATIATSNDSLDHPSIVGKFRDPNREGWYIYISDLNASLGLKKI